ncbi:MAG: hypothetical protein M1274_04805, partial [Actinobacteria bacterium]|nr:hypothetical protein [Actinomycetota bacterium]
PVVGMSLNHQLVRTLVGLREDGVRLAVLYVPGHTFAKAADSPGTLLPFLPPKGIAGRADSPAPVATLSAEDRALLLSLASAGIPSLTLDRGDDLVRTLSLWQTTRRHGAVLR